MKKASVGIASMIAIICLGQAFLSQAAVRIDPTTGGVKHVMLLWPVIVGAVAAVAIVALLADFVLLAGLCAYVILLVSLISFFSIGLLVFAPAAILIMLIGVNSRRRALSPR